MNEQFDRALRNHIRDTFDHYDDLMADDGWEKFKKQKARKNRGLILWYSLPTGIAAALALLWIFNITTMDITDSGTALSKNEIENPLKKDPTSTKKLNQTEKERPAPLNAEKETQKLAAVTPTRRPGDRKTRSQLSTPVSFTETTKTMLAQIKIEEAKPVQLTAKYAGFSILETVVPASELQKREPTQNKESLAFNNELLKNEVIYPENPTSKPKESSVKKTSAFNFSVDANTYYSFTDAGVDNDLNMGLGIISELKISKRLSINSGISLNQQTTRYQGNKNSASVANTMSAPNNKVASIAKQQPLSVPESVETNAKLVGLDIPINLRYNLPLGKAKTFITTGISSYSLLNQSYTNDISVTNYSLLSAPTTTVLRSSEKERDAVFSNFQFARTVNFSFGILYPVSNKNSISVEPFIKYPIAGFGSQDLEIGSGGISFKLTFGK